ncbi:hypothetical protein LOAG_01880 [Loa loa]|uniref:Uncharacterized protein n=1 Tax=Loa loa TaxID=7209 RepID=A0A1S0U863_LOALO|nr:hypothetical protein LOAG_01880 [Loa loa]EFO26607.1 hypothetical protein LOAG_01880 [Loa loa]
MEGDNHPAKRLANYKLANSYTFFGTVHIKTSATMLTVFYILSLAIADFTIDVIMTDSSSLTYATTASVIILLAILLAQYGMWKESSLCLLPLIFIQILLGATMILTFAFSSFIEFHCFLIEACPSGRLLMLGMGSAIFFVSHCYCIVIIWFCWKYFRFVERKAKLEQTWHAETADDEIDENVLISNMSLNKNFTQC